MDEGRRAGRGSEWAPPRDRQRWGDRDGAAMVAALAASGATPAEFARRHGLETQRVLRWRAKVASDGSGAPGAVSRAPTQVTFAPLRLVESARRTTEPEPVGTAATKIAALEVVVGRLVVRVPVGFDPAELASVISALEERAC